MDLINTDQKLYDFLSGRLSGEEVKEVKEWIEADEKNRVYFQHFKKEFLEIRWGLRSRLIGGNYEELQKKLLQRRRFLRCKKLAAVVILLVGVCSSFLIHDYFSSMKSPLVMLQDSIRPGTPQAILELSSGQRLKLDSLEQEVKERNGISLVTCGGALSYSLSDSVQFSENLYNRLIIPRGGEYMIQLSDGSKVWLNAATEFQFPVAFVGEQRKVYLKGEAYFEVAKDSLHPFIVVADDVEVKVYGTKFDVNSYHPEKIQTILIEGAVGMKRRGEEVRLKPGQKGETGTTDINVTEVDVTSYVAWKNGDFIFNNERLEDIMEQIARWYDVNVFYSCKEHCDVRLSGDMKRYKEVQSLLYYFERISQVRFTIKGKTIVVE